MGAKILGEEISRREEITNVAENAATVAAARTSGIESRAVMRVVLIIVVILLVILAAGWILYSLTSVLVLLILSIFFAYLIEPLVGFVRRPLRIGGREREMPRAVAIGIVYVVIFGSIAVAVWLLLPRIGNQLADFAKQAPQYLTNARARANGLNEIYTRMNLPQAVREAANNAVTGVINGLGGYITGEGFNGALYVLGFVPWLVLVPILAFFLLKDAESFKRSALLMLPQGRIRWRGDEFFQDINSTLAAYIRAQLTACLIIGGICSAGFALLHVRYALVLGLVAGLLEFIPLLGPLVIAVAAFIIAGLDAGSSAALVLLFLAVLRIVQDYVIYPRLIGSGIHLHPLAVILAILAGNEMAGLTGIFLAIPVIAILTVTYRHWIEHRGGTGIVAELLKPTDATPATGTDVEATPDFVTPTTSQQTSALSHASNATASAD